MIPNQMSYVFNDSSKIKNSYIQAANVPTKIIVREEYSKKTITNKTPKTH